VPRKRRYTHCTLAVMATLASQSNAVWSTQQIADHTGLAYSTVYVIINKLFAQGLVYRSALDGETGPVGYTRWWYDLSERGEREQKMQAAYFPDPVGALKAFTIDDEDVATRLSA
jgi:predicted transcriptional regulator